MNARMNAAMLEAARLTRTGQVLEATKMIQRLLHPGEESVPTANSANAGTEAPIDGEFYVIGTERAGAARPEQEANPRPSPGPKAKVHGGTVWPGMDLGALKEQWRGFKEPMTPARPIRTPDPLPDGARFIAGTYTNPAGARSYKLYVPSGYLGSRCPSSSCSTAAPRIPTISLPVPA